MLGSPGVLYVKLYFDFNEQNVFADFKISEAADDPVWDQCCQFVVKLH